MTAFHHEVSVIHEISLIHRKIVVCGFDDGSFRIVDQYHDMRHLDRSALTDADARGDTGQHGALGRADAALIARSKVILLEVECEHQAEARVVVFCFSVQDDEARIELGQDALIDVIIDRSGDIRETLIDLFRCLFLEIYFRQEHTKSRRCISYSLFYILPVLRLGCELVAGDNRPLAKICSFLRQKDLRCRYGNVFIDGIHGYPPMCFEK